jgi:hypothetical protein
MVTSSVDHLEGIDTSWTAAVQAAHRDLSEADFRFRQLARRDRELLTFGAIDGESRAKFRFPLQVWPTFIGQRKLADLRRVSVAVSQLIKSIPRRFFGNDATKICGFYGLESPVAAEILLAPPSGIEEAVARGDLISTADGFKCIEFNFSPSLGGWETTLLARVHLGVPGTARFLRHEGLRVAVSPTTKLLFIHVLRQVRRLGLASAGEANMAIVLAPDIEREASFDETVGHLRREFEEACGEVGGGLHGRVILCSFGDLSIVNWRLYCGDLPIHGVVDISNGAVDAAVFRCFKWGGVSLLNAPIDAVLSTKENIALLSEHATSELFSADEREVIRCHIPWTRRAVAAKTDFLGEEVFLPDLLASHRERLVLKEGRSYGGQAVVLGKFTPSAAWSAAVEKALADGRWIVQEHLESEPYVYQCGDSGYALHDVIWGPFVFGDTYAGVILRMQAKAASAAVNLSLAATEGVVFEVADSTD